MNGWTAREGGREGGRTRPDEWKKTEHSDSVGAMARARSPGGSGAAASATATPAGRAGGRRRTDRERGREGGGGCDRHRPVGQPLPPAAHALRSDLREPRNNLEARCFVCHVYLGNVLNYTDVYRNP